MYFVSLCTYTCMCPHIINVRVYASMLNHRNGFLAKMNVNGMPWQHWTWLLIAFDAVVFFIIHVGAISFTFISK